MIESPQQSYDVGTVLIPIERTETEFLKEFPKVTQLMSGRTKMELRSVWFQNPGSSATPCNREFKSHQI